MKRHLVLPVVILSGLLSGCHPRPAPAPTYESWIQTQDAIARVINQHVGDQHFSVGAIHGAIYPLGTTFNGRSPDDSCQFPNDVIHTLDVVPWPDVYEDRTFGFDASGMPPQWTKAIGVGKISANINSQQATHVKYASLRQVFVYDSGIKAEMCKLPCYECLAADTNGTRIIRGQYVGTLLVSSTNSFDIGANFNVTNVAGLNVKYSANRGFVIEQTNAIAWFAIFSRVRPDVQYTNMTMHSALPVSPENPRPSMILASQTETAASTATSANENTTATASAGNYVPAVAAATDMSDAEPATGSTAMAGTNEVAAGEETNTPVTVEANVENTNSLPIEMPVKVVTFTIEKPTAADMAELNQIR